MGREKTKWDSSFPQSCSGDQVCYDLPSEIKAGLVWGIAVCTAHLDALAS